MTGFRSLLTLGVVLTLLSASSARAESLPLDPGDSPSSRAAGPGPGSLARERFFAGRELMSLGRIAEACVEFEASRQLEPGIGTDLNLADCWERLGRFLPAHDLFQSAAEAADLAGQTDRAVVARERAQSLAGRLPRLSIRVESPVPGQRVELDGDPVNPADWGRSLRVEPGAHEIVVHAPDRASWSVQLSLPPQAASVQVDVPRLQPTSSAEKPPRSTVVAPQSEASSSAAPSSAPDAAEDDERRHPRGRTVPALTLATAGVGGLLFGTVSLVQYAQRNTDAKDICPSSRGCTAAQIEAHDELVSDARAFRSNTYVGYGAGGLALGAAVIWLAVGRRQPDSPGAVPASGPAVAFTDGGALATFSGTF